MHVMFPWMKPVSGASVKVFSGQSNVAFIQKHKLKLHVCYMELLFFL